jgi:hypothetical protein
MATDNGKVSKWRENLGRDHLTAQYRARAMFIVWIEHLRTNGALEPDVPSGDGKQEPMCPLS